MTNLEKIERVPITPNQSSSVSISRSSTTPPIRNINHKTFANILLSTPEQSSSIPTDEITRSIEFAKAYQHQAVSSQVQEPKKVSTNFLLKHLDEKQRKSIANFLKDNNISINDSTFVNMHFIGYIPESLNSKIINLIEVNSKYFEVNEERTYKSVDNFLKENNIGPGKFLFYDNNSKKVQTIDKLPTLGQKIDTAVTTAALISLVVPAAVLGGSQAAGAIAFGTTVYFGAKAVYTIADDFVHGVRSPIKFIKNAGWVLLGTSGLGGKAGKYALGIAAGSKTGKAAQIVINLSKAGEISGGITILGSLTYEANKGLKEIMDKDAPDDIKMEMIKYAAVQMGLMVIVTVKGKTFTLKDEKMPKELIPSKAVQLETDKILLKHGGGIKCLARIWANTVTKGKETVQAIENFYNITKSAGKRAAAEAIKYLSDLYSEGSQALTNSIIIFADRHKLPIIPERIQEFVFAGSPRIQQTGQVGLRVPSSEQVENARAYFASDPARRTSAAGGVSGGTQSTNIGSVEAFPLKPLNLKSALENPKFSRSELEVLIEEISKLTPREALERQMNFFASKGERVGRRPSHLTDKDGKITAYTLKPDAWDDIKPDFIFAFNKEGAGIIECRFSNNLIESFSNQAKSRKNWDIPYRLMGKLQEFLRTGTAEEIEIKTKKIGNQIVESTAELKIERSGNKGKVVIQGEKQPNGVFKFDEVIETK